MFPVHQLDMYPHQRNQMQSAPQRYPSFEAIPPHMRADPDRVYYQSWPWSSNYGYAYPTQCHGCCEHHHFPGYNGLRSPCPQPPPPFYHSSYPVPTGAFPAHYIPPPPHHTVELPRYEYDKDVSGYYHCCGCPNHPCNQKVGKILKIEEEGPHSENKMDDSLVPFNPMNYPNPLVWHLPNNIKNKEDVRSSEPQYGKEEDGCKSAKIHYPYPILWFPPSYVTNKEDNTSNEPQYKKLEDDFSGGNANNQYPSLWFPPTYIRNEEDSASDEPRYEKQERSTGSKTREISKPSEQQRNFTNGWFPFDISNLRPSKSQSLRQQQQQGDDKRGFTCPVFWMPYKADEEENKANKRTGIDQECAQTAPSNLEVFPVMVPETKEDNKGEMKKQVVGDKGLKQTDKASVQKTIPVKQAGLDEEEKNKEKTKSCGMPLNDSEMGKSSDDGGKRKSSSPPKSSKLPPVCLRVDPLPRKKNANGSSRSPSPPGDKGKSHEACRENVKPATSLDAKESTSERSMDKEQHKSKIKTIQVSEGTGSQAGNGDPLPGSSHGKVLGGQTNERPQDAVGNLAAPNVKCKSVAGANDEAAVEDKSIPSGCQIDENKETSKAEEKAANKAKESKKKSPSEAEAARIIQAAYRGYEVRRWEPLKKLKQVMEVRRKVAELKSSIQAFESSPNIQDFDKWGAVTGETIMHLLLKLDTIQGMHPSIRDVRKSVARELVGLQEKVDHLTRKKTDTLTQQAAPVLFGQDVDNRDGLCIKEGQEEEKQEETGPVNECHQEVSCEGKSSPRIHALTNFGNLDILETVEDPDVNPQESIVETDKFSNSQSPDIPAIIMNEGENHGEEIKEANTAQTDIQKIVVIPQVDDQAVNPVQGGTCSLLKNEVSGLSDLEELPKGELGENTCKQDNLAQNEAGEDTAPEYVVLMNELPKGVLEDNTDVQDNTESGGNEVSAESYPESKELEQLPQGVLGDDDDDDDDYKSNKHLHIEEEEDKSKSEAVTADINAQVPDGGVLNMNQAEQEQETTLKVLVTSEVNENLGYAEDNDNKAELVNMLYLGSKDAVEAPEGETSVEFKSVDEREVHDKEGAGTKAKDFNGDKSEVSGYCAEANETPAVNTTTERKEVSGTCEEEVSELSFFESGNKCTSGETANATNSSSREPPQECDLPEKMSKRCDVEDKEKQLNDNFEQQASGGAAVVDGTFAQTGDSGALETELLDEVKFIPLETKQTEERDRPSSSPSAGQISLGSDALSEGDTKLIEENTRLREMMKKLIEAGQEQLTAISNLSTRVKDLEKRVSKKKKKLKLKRNGTSRPSSGSGSVCLKPSNDPLKEKAVALAM